MSEQTTSPEQPEQLAPDARRPEPGERGLPWLIFRLRQAGVLVDETSALTFGAVFACIRVVAEGIASLPWGAFRALSPRGRERMRGSRVDNLLSVLPNEEVPTFQFREALVAHALSWGNGFAEIERDRVGRPVALWLLTPDRVEVGRDQAGRIVYDVANPRQANTVLPARDVFHLRGLGFDGLVGYPVIRLAARSIGQAIAMDQHLSELYADRAIPDGVLKHPRQLNERARENIRKSWHKLHGSGRRTVAILDDGLDWQATALSPEDAQLVQTRGMQAPEVCRWFRVQPHKIADLSRATFSNIEEQSREHVTDTLMPWALRLEGEANVKLFGPMQRGRFFTKFNFNALLRGKVSDRASFYVQMLDRGIFSINDVLELEDRNPIGPIGDRRLVLGNFVPLEEAGKQPEPPPAPPPPPGDDQGDDEQDDEGESAVRDALAHLHPVAAEALRRVIRRERHRAEAELKRSPDGDLAGWVEGFWGQHRDYVREALTPPLEAALAVLGAPDALGVVREAALDDHRADLASRCSNDALELWEGAADRAAEWLLTSAAAAAAAVKGGEDGGE